MTALNDIHSVSRGSFGRHPDVLIVTGEHGELATFERMGLDSCLKPQDAAEAKAHPWFFTGSPFGPEIVGLAWERHSVRGGRIGEKR
ncbi:hypothetical protein BSL82_03765 [Tardibacter chloracetimidivorans]|uniref:Uncharacterized protein n=1 Tax=Tardibacter chloracetimidivorans TaxID=1921510 RepID=A0A1L3ZSD2_9SPHN|nr:hypothetical protein [Tardibacter chloracetimidivorans]API58534.1 hypothetical protein BSL82_03765 [Tardibacter chloracetimidivorans]